MHIRICLPAQTLELRDERGTLLRRYIYLHGAPDTVAMGMPGSIGCVRMRNQDIVELFDRVPVYTPVDIVEFGAEEEPEFMAASDINR